MDKLLQWPVSYCIAGIALAFGFESIRASWWGLIALSGLIVLYAFLTKGDRDERRFQTGDNCYFIGFVYTLSIITASLILDAEKLLDGETQQGLLITIGIALGTSVIGMVARFWLTHDIRVSEDALDEAVRKAAVSAAQLAGTVEKLCVAFATAATTIDEQTRAGTDNLARTITTFQSRLDAAAAEAGRGLQTVVDRATDRIDQQASLLSEHTVNVVQELRLGAEAHVEATRSSLDTLASSLNNHGQEVEAAVKRAGEALEQTADTLQMLGDRAVERFGQQTSSLSNSATSVLQELQRDADARVRTTRESLDRLSSSLSGYAKELDASVKGVSETLGQGTRQAMAQIADGVSRALQANEAALVKLAQRDDVAAIGRTFAQFSQETSRLSDQVAKLVSAQASLTAEVERFAHRIAEQPSAGVSPARTWAFWPWRKRGVR